MVHRVAFLSQPFQQAGVNFPRRSGPAKRGAGAHMLRSSRVKTWTRASSAFLAILPWPLAGIQGHELERQPPYHTQARP